MACVFRWVKIFLIVAPMAIAGLSRLSYGVETRKSYELEVAESDTTGALQLAEEIAGQFVIDATNDLDLRLPSVEDTSNAVEKILKTISGFDPFKRVQFVRRDREQLLQKREQILLQRGTQLHHIDLQPQANHLLNEDFTPAHYPGDRLSELKKGVQKLGGISFRVGEGLIEVAGKFLPDYPIRVDGIEVGRHVKKIHILHGARWGAFGGQGNSLGHWVADGTPIGFYEVNYADAETEAIPIVYGVDVRDWWSVWDKSKPTKRGKVAWTGSNPHLKSRSEARHTKSPLRLYLTSWKNPHPESKVTSINLVSLNQTATPFSVAITVEGVPQRYSAKLKELEKRLRQLRNDFQRLKQQIDRDWQLQETSKLLFFDDFDGKLSPSWSVLNRNPENISLTKRTGMLTITTERGGLWRSYNNAKNIFLLKNPIPDGGDFVMTTHLVDFDPKTNYNQAGLICFDDMDNYLAFTLQWDSAQGGRGMCLYRESSGRDLDQPYLEIDSPLDSVWIRITKTGNRYLASFSQDGQKYQKIGAGSWGDGSPMKIGLIAKNGGLASGAPDIDASFDLFYIKPINKD